MRFFYLTAEGAENAEEEKRNKERGRNKRL
jgi:hypothetical protein